MERTANNTRYLFWLVAFAMIAIWVRRAFGPLWLDETVAYYTARDGFSVAIERAARFHLQPPTYYWILSALHELGMTSEAWLRAPSLIFAAFTAFAVFRIGALLFDRETGCLAALLFVASDGAIFSADSARPYALGMLATTVSVWALLSLREPAHRWRAIATYVVSTGFACHLMPFFFPILGVHAAIVLASAGKRPGISADMAIALAGCACVVTPLALALADLSGRAATFDTPGTPQAARVVLAFLPVAIPLLLFVTLLASNGMRRGDLSVPRARSLLLTRDGAWIAAWHALPPLVCLFLALSSGRSNWFSERYFSWNAPALSLLLAVFIGSFEPARGRLFAACLFTFLVLAAEPHRPIFTEDWRGGVAALRREIRSSEEPFLFYSGLVETLHPSTLSDAARRDYLTAPIDYYGAPGGAVLLPYRFDRLVDESYLRRAVGPILSSREEILILGSDTISVGGKPTSRRIAERLADIGWTVESVERYRRTFLMRARRSPREAHDH